MNFTAWFRTFKTSEWQPLIGARTERECQTESNEMRLGDSGDWLILADPADPNTAARTLGKGGRARHVTREPPVVERGHVRERLRAREGEE